ncbi:MAG: hypothetical protein LBE81_13145 [Azonexus sp.]|jgi:hypothetical protein|uniref:hypothetical protein n=1 Tax=Azonexus sp. TaxID=1872668 RepID=UPI002819F6B6|nr:hypothetical protein [Azonexus sp.]MDR0777562.1 hypothetical protein [Azonexus sp.]
MFKSNWMHTLFAAAAVVFTAGIAPASAAEEPVFGWQLMTEQEQIEQRQKMLSAKTPEEREAVRSEHHQRMLERARQQGVTLPDPPPQGMGPGMGGGRGTVNRQAPSQP